MAAAAPSSEISTKRRYWIIWSVTALLVLVIMLAVALLFWSELSPEQRVPLSELAPKIVAYGLTALIVNLILFGNLLRYLFAVYLDPIAKLADETRLINVANAKYRIVPEGGEEVIALTRAINELADTYIRLKTDVQQIVQHSKTGLDDDKRRLETLMAQMPEGVIVCNADGRVLLYNHKANAIAQRRHQPGERPTGARDDALLGLGRSVFGVVDRRPIVYALNYLQNRLDEGQTNPIFTFTTTRGKDQFIQVRMAAVTGADGETSTIDGYVLTMSDVTSRIEADSRRDIFLQSLTIGLQQQLQVIRDAVTALKIHPTVKETGLVEYAKLIDGSSSNLLEQIDAVAIAHASRLEDSGEAEHLLGGDLMAVLHETLVEQFGLEVATHVEDDLWLGVNSYTVVRGVVYLVGQLTKHLEVKRIDLDLREDGDSGYLTVHWEGDPVTIKAVEEWRQCPLMTQARDTGAIGLANLLTGRGGITSTQGDDAETVSVRFELTVEHPESKWSQETSKSHRPVFYEFDLFDADSQSTEFDELPLDQLSFVAFDTETTGLAPSEGDEIISLGAIRIVNGKLRREEVFDQLVDPRRSVPLESLKIHEIYPEMLVGMPVITEVLPGFHRFAEGSVLVAHNAAFDMKFLQLKQRQAAVEFTHPVLDTLLLSAVVHPNHALHNLDEVVDRLGLPVLGRHTALGDAIMTGEVLLRFIPLLRAKGIRTLGEARHASRRTQYSDIKF